MRSLNKKYPFDEGVSIPMAAIQLSVTEKISYGLGDTACNLVWQTVMMFMSYFYTDIYGLSPAHMGTMFLAVRCIDAVADVFMGAYADRTRTKYGQFRPYILLFAIPFGVICMMTFYTPNFSYMGKLAYAYGSYILLSLAYTAVNVPYCAMVNNLSNNSRERVSIQSYRFALSTMGGLIVSMTALPLVKYLGHGNVQSGYFLTMLVMSILSIILFLVCFKNTKERNIPELTNKSNSIAGDLRCLISNKDWRIMFAINVVNLVACIFKGGTTLYYVNTVLGHAELGTLLLTTTSLAGIVGALISPKIFKNIDKVKGFKYSMALEAICLFLMYFVPPEQVYVIVGMIVLINVIQLASTPLQWSMVSDVTDLEEKRSGRRLSGMVFSTNLFAIKLGIAIGGALIGWILAMGGYVGGAAVQTATAIQSINLLYTVFQGILVLSLVFIMNKYSLNDAAISEMQKS